MEFTKNPCVEELADVKEVIDALSEIEWFKDVLKVQKKKKEERGGFGERILLMEVYDHENEL
jgi:predicted house-cleaning noncanonical NTP pyrophosphatase (MazG superfamily)